MSGLIWFGLGCLVTWFVTHVYYEKSSFAADQAALAQRLDACSEGDTSFLVALLQHGEAIPRYSLINVDFVRQDGSTGSWGSNTPTMIRSVGARTSHCFAFEGTGAPGDLDQTVTLSARGRENAEYLLRTSYRHARFTQVEADENTRRSLSQYDGSGTGRGAVSVSGSVTTSAIGSVRIEP